MHRDQSKGNNIINISLFHAINHVSNDAIRSVLSPTIFFQFIIQNRNVTSLGSIGLLKQKQKIRPIRILTPTTTEKQMRINTTIQQTVLFTIYGFRVDI